jgi:hypothetical protein
MCLTRHQQHVTRGGTSAPAAGEADLGGGDQADCVVCLLCVIEDGVLGEGEVGGHIEANDVPAGAGGQQVWHVYSRASGKMEAKVCMQQLTLMKLCIRVLWACHLKGSCASCSNMTCVYWLLPGVGSAADAVMQPLTRPAC